MSDVKRLMDEATPLPWIANDHEFVFGPDGDSVAKTYSNLAIGGDASANADLIVYAVSRLPAYEAAVEALHNIVEAWDPPTFGGDRTLLRSRIVEAREALARLREQAAERV